MKQIIIFVFCALVATSGALDGGLRVRFDIGLTPGSTFFYNLPRTIEDAVSEGWSQTERPAGPLSQLVMYCFSDRVLCVFFDDTEYIAGLQIALSQDKYTDSVFDWETLGYTEWEPSVADGETVTKYWTTQQYFVSEESLQKSVEERLASRNEDKTLQEGGVWVTGFNGELVKIPDTKEGIENSIFTKQACIPGMGRHYYYNMSADTTCDSNTMFPWFPLEKDGELVAIGFTSFGQLPVVEGERNWFERPPRLAVKVIVPRGPECLYDLATSPGLVTMHIYYVERPWLITCLL